MPFLKFIVATMGCWCYSIGITAQSIPLITGQVLDVTSAEPIPFAHIRSDSAGTVSNWNGYFQLDQRFLNSPVIVTHVNYQAYSLLLSPDIDTIIVYLKRSTVQLDEVVVGILPSEEKFKKEIIENNIPESKEVQNATDNIRLATIMYLSGHQTSMTSLDNFKDFIKGPQGVSIFSSDPSKGFIKSIKNLSNKPLFQYQNKINPDSSLMLFKLRKTSKTKTNTLKSDN